MAASSVEARSMVGMIIVNKGSREYWESALGESFFPRSRSTTPAGKYRTNNDFAA
jgi:hypothetical protein